MAFWNKKDNDEKTIKKKKPVWREWLDAGLFAVVAATLIRTFVFEAYTIPTGSMEGSMLVNDYLFVSKMSYGPRIPMTPLAFPLVHNSLPLTGGKSYVESVQWKYRRWPGFGNIERNDVVVFNFPAGDTVMADRPADDIYAALRDEYNYDRDAMNAAHKILVRPVDKKENYIKRCVGLPGDKLEVRDAVLYINDKPGVQFPHQKFTYALNTSQALISQYVNDNELEMDNKQNYFLENVQVDEIRKFAKPGDIIQDIAPKGQIPVRGYLGGRTIYDYVYPADTTNFKWNCDNYGPIVIPKEGATVAINPQNIALYRRVIRNYERNKLEEKDGKIYINDKEATSYTFKMDYYWLMGDNRHNSLDSRYWGFVPIDHVVGKAWFVWFSYHKEGMGKGIRWSRLFHSVHSLEK